MDEKKKTFTRLLHLGMYIYKVIISPMNEPRNCAIDNVNQCGNPVAWEEAKQKRFHIRISNVTFTI